MDFKHFQDLVALEILIFSSLLEFWPSQHAKAASSSLSQQDSLSSKFIPIVIPLK
jgi:hypothetical protein